MQKQQLMKADLAAAGMNEEDDALEILDDARELAVEGAEEIAEGAAELGAAAEMEEVAETIRKESDK